MFCAQCGTEANPASRRCVKCDSDLSGWFPSASPSTTGDVTMAPPTDAALTHRPASGDTLVPGQKFGTRYTIIKKLGVGGMGAVYQAWDESLGVAVALKVIRMDDVTSPEETRQLEARFKRELLLARQVTHPNVVRIHDLGELGESKYLTMAYVDGADLATVMRREGKLPVERALAIFRQITEGLSAAHAAGVIHRDLKPANVMLDAEGRALLTDFGIARSLDAGTLQTMPGSIMGTLDYMAPEQARGEAADHRSDVYSLGLILYELLAGGRPRATAAGGLADLLARVADGPPPLGTVASDVPLALQKIVARCLDRNPQARYATAAELLRDLDQLGPDGRPRPTVISRRPPLLHVALAAIVVLAIAGFGWWMTARPPVPPPAAKREPVSILIADFDNRAKDPVFEGALEQALAIGMEGAPFVANYPRADAVKLARNLRPGASLDASTAQLVAVREEVGVVLAGSVAQESGGYLLQVRALRPGTEEAFATLEERATSKADVLRAIDRLARSLRTALGDTPVAVSQAESFSAGSLEAVREYTIAQTLSIDRKNDEAIEHYKAAIKHDSQFGRAYAGWAVSAFDLGRRAEAEQLWTKAMSLMDRMSEREKYRTLGGYYIGVARNYDKAIEAYQELVEKYPADVAGHNNLALAYFFTLDFPKALEYGKRAIDVYPHSLKIRNNYALYAMYAGDFKTAAENAQRVLQEDPKYDVAYLPLAMAALSEGDVGKARSVYAKARESGAAGASLAAIGLADVALYEGRAEEAATILTAAIPTDRQAGNTVGAASKTVALAEARAASAGAAEGARLIADLAAEPSDESISVPAARLLGAARQDARALQLAHRLDERTQAVPRAYARIIAGEVAMRQRRFSEAINEFSTAVKTADLWLARFDLGVAYVEAGRYAEAISELDGCVKRRGEATALFFDDVPTYRYAAVLPYWLGRAQQGLKMGGAAASFEQFLRIRAGAAATDPLVIDARKRLDSLASPSAPR
jgi:tetratricopeptide (TPR) repeat protein